MKIFQKFKSLILPETIDFFGQLSQQSIETKEIIHELQLFYLNKDTKDTEHLFSLIHDAKESRIKYLKELNTVFITPVDKEAISRAYEHLHWIVLSVKHLIFVMNEFKIYELKDYETLLTLLYDETDKLAQGYSLLKDKKYNDILKLVYDVIHLDNLLIKEYANLLNKLFKIDNLEYVLKRKEILRQIKEIAKRTHICANQLEDIVFKLN